MHPDLVFAAGDMFPLDRALLPVARQNLGGLLVRPIIGLADLDDMIFLTLALVLTETATASVVFVEIVFGGKRSVRGVCR